MHLKEGSFEIDFKLVKLGAKLAEDDRQCAWELYTEMVTRVSIVGKADDRNCSNFDGELLSESLDSMYKFFQEARNIMKKFPVGKIGKKKNHLGILIHEMMRQILRPFLEKWHIDYRHWWELHKNDSTNPIEIQRKYPKYKLFMADWQDLRLVMRAIEDELISIYDLVKVREQS